MTERLNKTSICSVIFLDIVGYSQKTAAEQTTCKACLNALISRSVMGIAQTDRIILDTGDGAAISLLGAPEEALFVAMSIRDRILSTNLSAETQLLVRIGINLGPVRVVKDVNANLNIIGDGINVAQRVMSYAAPNTILASRSYFEIVSRLSSDITRMFTYFGIKTGNHMQNQEIYLISTGKPAEPSQPSIQNGNAAEKESPSARNHWTYAAVTAAVFLTGSLIASQGPASAPMTNHIPALQATGTEVALKEEKKKISTKTQSYHRGKDIAEKRRLYPSEILCTDAQRMMHQCS